MVETETPKTQTEVPKVQENVPAPAPQVKAGKEKRHFELYDTKTGEVLMTLVGRVPRQAALKAAAEGVTDVLLRERASSKADKKIAALMYRFAGSRVRTKWPMPYPTWLVKKLQVPADQNVKGNEAKFPHEYFKPVVKRTGYYKVTVVAGKTHAEVISDFAKSLSK